MMKFFYNRRNLYIIGLLLAFIITFMEFSRGRHMNFMIFADSTLDFWRGISPYTSEWWSEHTRFFLYSPIFSVLFTPFAVLPAWLGPFAWNLFNYTMFFIAVFSLPKRFTHEQKCRIFLFTLPILGQSLLSFQYNIPIAYMFLFAFTLLERGKGFWAVCLIMISGSTKIYGIFELALLVCYPRFWRNIGYVILVGAGLFALPLSKLAPAELLPYYNEWFGCLSTHQSVMSFDSLFYARPFAEWMLANFRILQIGSLTILAILFLCSVRKWPLLAFRAQALGILMSWVVLFSDSAEKHTYIIALAGFMLWYWSRSHNRTDKILFWSVFALMCIVPIDILVPVPVSDFITSTLWLHVWVFTFVWLRMVWKTFMCHITDIPDHCEEITDTHGDTAENDKILDIICPCYNPSPNFITNLARSMGELRNMYSEYRLHLIVSNDGSTRNFGPEEHAALLLTIPDSEIVDSPHGGKGSAIRAGITRSTASYSIYTDIDMPYSKESMKQVIDRVFAGVDVVIAVRNQSYHSKLSPLRKLMSYGSKMLNRIFLNTSHTDTQGGLKGLSPKARKIMLRTTVNDFLFDTEFIILASGDGSISIEEIETTLREGIVMSKMPLRVMFRELKNFFRIAFRI